MKTKRAILFGILLWILIFVEISITAVGLSFSQTTVWIIHYILLIPITILCCSLYYKSSDKTNGFLLGLVFIVIGIILDLIITVPMFIIPQGGSYASHFIDAFLIIGFIELIAISGIYQKIKKNETKNH